MSIVVSAKTKRQGRLECFLFGIALSGGSMASVKTTTPAPPGEEVTEEGEGRKKERGGSMSLRTRKLGRRLSRSMSIVALKLPEKAQSITRKSSKLMRASGRDKKTKPFELSVILPDKTQRQVTVSGGSTVAEVISEVLRELGTTLAEGPSAPLSAPLSLALGAPLPAPPPSPLLASPPAALLFLGDCKAPVDSRAAAAALEGEVLVVETQPPPWDGTDLHTFIAWENIYASTLLSAVELYGKPLLRAAAITKEEYQLIFYYLQIVSEASTSLTERMQSYLDSGLLKNYIQQDEESSRRSSVRSVDDREQPKSILNELLQEGLLTQRDLDISDAPGAERCESRSECNKCGDECDASVTGASRHVTESICGSEIAHSMCETDSHYDEERAADISIITVGGQCCTDHRISSDVNENVWANVRWNFLSATDFGYDSVRSVKRSRSDSALSPRTVRRRDDIYETLADADEELSAADEITPYESIEDLYDCIKSAQYADKSEESTPSTESRSEPHYPDSCSDKASVAMRQSSTGSEQSAGSSAFPYSKSDRNSGSSASAEYVSRLFPRREPPPPPPRPLGHNAESAILLHQLFSGELKDVYGEYLAAYRHARALLRSKMRHDEHFVALADIRKGVAKHTIQDYLELPIERLAQYERLVGAGGGGCGRRRGARLSDLERVQDLFPHDYLALHEHDALATQLAAHATQKTKSLRKRPSLELSGAQPASGGCGAPPGSSPRTFVMEAPVTLRAISPEGSPSLDRHLFLFSDVLLVGKSRGTNCFKLKESVRLAETWLALPDADDTGFLVGWPSSAPGAPPLANYLASYPTQAARDTWYRKLQHALNSQLATEPKSTNIQVLYKDTANSIEFCKTLSVSPEQTSQAVVQQALQVLQNNNVETDAEGGPGAWGPACDFTLCARAARDAPPVPLHGIERPHAIQMSRMRQTLSSEDGFDLEHVNAKNHPCGMVFELRKKNNGLKSTTSPGVGGRGLRLLRRGGASSRLFGVALARLHGGAPPPLVLQLLRRLRAHAPHTHGVFRRSANARALRLLRDKLDSLGGGCASCAELERAPILLLAALLKDFFRSLPQPLLADQLYHSWIAVLGLPPMEKLAAVRSLLLKLPKSHYTMLTYFVCLLQAIAKKSAINLMCPMNLGVCVGPSLLWPSAPCDKAPKAVPMVIEFLIVKADALFGPQIGNLLGSGSPESSNALLDSGAEESDSLHSVGISLDSMELSSPRKEKLSLSRDSGLTLSEDDSNSNGGNSPAPRNVLHSLSAPAAARLAADENKYGPARRTGDAHNVNGLPHTTSSHRYKSDIYSPVLSDDYYASPYSTERYVHNSIDVGIERTYVVADRTKARREDIYAQTPAKYITGLEPQKPPRSNVSKAARTSKVYSMFSENQESGRADAALKTFNRAKSSDNLLDIKQAQHDSKLASSQENILYGNITNLSILNEEQHCRDAYQNAEFLSNTNYSRVYTGWEKRSAAYARAATDRAVHSENVYGRTGDKSQDKKHFTPAKNGTSATQAATIFTRNDWSRQAARTKSLEVNEDTYVSKCGDDRSRGHFHDADKPSTCHRRRLDPSHLCSNGCTQRAAPEHAPSPKKTPNPLQTSYSYVDNPHLGSPASEGKKPRHRCQNNNQRIPHSKSLANIILQSDSSSSDTLYQPQGLQFHPRSTDSTASENSFENHYAAQYTEPVYTSIYSRRRDLFNQEQAVSNGTEVYSSDIYTAKPTSVQPDFTESQAENGKTAPAHHPPPVPPRKILYQKILKKFHPVHVSKDDRTSRSKSVPPAYREPPASDKLPADPAPAHADVLALDCSDTDTESESYV